MNNKKSKSISPKKNADSRTKKYVPRKKSHKPAFKKTRSFGKKRLTSFDPSLFIKKVEEQPIAKEYIPKNTFNDFGLYPQLQKNIEKKGYLKPTPIQDQVIPHLIEGRDIIGAANTGTGKTAAFLIPLIHNVLNDKVSRVLIIAPTRELATQIHQEFKSFTAKISINAALCIGGASTAQQKKVLKSHPAFVIGTPGRLIDLENIGALRINFFDAIVLDEVDRMLDMGFVKEVTSILNKLPKKRLSLFFSATLSKDLDKLMQQYANDPIQVNVRSGQSAQNVNQEIIKVGTQKKIELLHDTLIAPACKKALIFVRTKRSVNKLASDLSERGFKVGIIHSDRTQAQRNKALQAFKADKINILLATDVVARGIDVDDITHVINYDLPQTYEDYIHRIGRTGRAGRIGQAITFV